MAPELFMEKMERKVSREKGIELLKYREMVNMGQRQAWGIRCTSGVQGRTL